MTFKFSVFSALLWVLPWRLAVHFGDFGKCGKTVQFVDMCINIKKNIYLKWDFLMSIAFPFTELDEYHL
jgi:hypothetical protein